MFAHKPSDSNQPGDSNSYSPLVKQNDQQVKQGGQPDLTLKDSQQVDYVSSYQPPAQKSKTEIQKPELEQKAGEPSQAKTEEKSSRPQTIQRPEIQKPELEKKEEKTAEKESREPDREETNQPKLPAKKEEDQSQPPKKDEPEPKKDEPNPKKTSSSDDQGEEEESEALEEQNIFVLLGVKDGDQEEKDQFLNELQQVIWEDFLENDLPLLVTTAEKKDIDQILENKELNDLDKQDKIIQYLDKIIPDLEEIMLEKALELKEELVLERVAAMREFYSKDQDKQDKVSKAQELFNQKKWASGTKLLNQISS